MAALKPVSVTLSGCREHFVMSRDAWTSAPVPVSDLPAWIAFYSTLRDRNGTPADAKRRTPAKSGPYASIYQPWVDALTKLKRELGATNGPV